MILKLFEHLVHFRVEPVSRMAFITVGINTDRVYNK
jgi:hypothetical protein